MNVKMTYEEELAYLKKHAYEDWIDELPAHERLSALTSVIHRKGEAGIIHLPARFQLDNNPAASERNYCRQFAQKIIEDREKQ